MYTPILLSALLAGNVLAADTPLKGFPPNLTDPYITTTINLPANISVGNATGIIVNSTSAADNNTIVVLNPIVPPVAAAKRGVGGDDGRCGNIRATMNIRSPEPIEFGYTYCSALTTLITVCWFYNEFGELDKVEKETYCPFGLYCVQYGDFEDTTAWCQSDDGTYVWILNNPGDTSRRVRYGGWKTQKLKVVNQYWDRASGNARVVANTTFLSTSPAHIRTELDNNVHAESDVELVATNQGWDVLLTPGGYGQTVVTSFLLAAG